MFLVVLRNFVQFCSAYYFVFMLGIVFLVAYLLFVVALVSGASPLQYSTVRCIIKSHLIERPARLRSSNPSTPPSPRLT